MSTRGSEQAQLVPFAPGNSPGTGSLGRSNRAGSDSATSIGDDDDFNGNNDASEQCFVLGWGDCSPLTVRPARSYDRANLK